MSVRAWWKRLWSKPKKQEPKSNPGTVSKENLREFVYLDEVSLRSLLSSLYGDLRDGTSEDLNDALETEVTASMEASNTLVGKAGVSSRFQTTNSSSIQTSRKSTVQSWFRDFRKITNIRLIEKSEPKSAAGSVDELKRTSDTSLLAASGDLRRGELVEFRVVLAADPVFHLSTATSEIAGMAQDFPEMFQEHGGAESIHQLAPVRKILERLLAGLVPIRAVAVDYGVIQIDGSKYVVHKKLVEGLDFKVEPLQIVGVTELLAYWKDLRRILFSEAEFTLLARLSRSGIQQTWTPVKLADLFREMVPDLVREINTAGKIPFAQQRSQPDSSVHRLSSALSKYSTLVLELSDTQLDSQKEKEMTTVIEQLQGHVGSVSDQRNAFAELQRWLNQQIPEVPGAEKLYEFREMARQNAGLSFFPALQSSTPAAPGKEQDIQKVPEDEHLLDVEIIAIYW